MICYLEDVVNTWKTYDNHPEDVMKHGPLFLSPIENPVSKVWYKKASRVGIHTISCWQKVMAEDVGVEGRITNKSSRKTTITRMSLANVPQSVMCQITGYKNANSLDRYDDSLKVACEATMQTLEPITRDNDLQY